MPGCEYTTAGEMHDACTAIGLASANCMAVSSNVVAVLKISFYQCILDGLYNSGLVDLHVLTFDKPGEYSLVSNFTT